jgi:acetyl-CoA synthetase
MAQPKVKADLPIEALLKEKRKFPPPKAFVKNAVMNRKAIYAEAARNPVKFWEQRARELHWFKPWKKALEWKPPYAKWFIGGKLNVAYNCLDRHVEGPRKTKAALVWEGEPGDSRVLTYWDLYREVNLFAAALKRHGVRKGDRITIYMPMVPELPIAMLACARIGAAHSVIFGGFSPEAVRERIHDAESTLVITADGGYRRGATVPLKKNTDEALQGAPGVKTVIVLKRTGQPIEMQSGRDIWWDDFVKGAPARCPAEPMDSEDLLYLLYTSGSTGKPKGIIHTTAGYLTGVAATHRWIFDLHDDDVYWCTADIGWVTGHSYIVYGPLANGATTVMYEGTPDYPDKDRFWRIVEKYGVTICYTAPTAIRTFMKWGEEYPKRCDLSSLRLLGSVGEPINPEAWVWYWKVIGGGRCPVVDTWWQTETGHILITPLPALTVLKPGSATLPFPGIDAEVLDEKGKPAKAGYLVLRKPWPGMLRGIWGDPDRFVKQYWSKYDNIYFTGDGAKRDEDGYFWLLGRVDDVMNVSGHRVSTMEVESALVDHKSVAEAAVIGKTHDIKGQAIAAFVTVKSGVEGSPQLMDELKAHVAKKIGSLARPDDVIFSAELPKTRSGKIMRRLLRDIAEGRALGDTTTLADPTVVAQLKTKYEEQEG